MLFEDKLTLACLKQPNENAVRKAFWLYFKNREVTVPGVTESAIVVLGPKDWESATEDEGAEAPAPPQTVAPPPPPPPPAASTPAPVPPTTDSGAALLEAYKKLLPQMNEKVAARPELKDPLARVARQFQEELRAGAFDNATRCLEDLTKLVQGSPVPQAAKRDGNDLVAAYKKLVPEMTRMAAENPALKEPLTRAAKQFEEALKSQKFDDAQRALDELAQHLQSKDPVASPPGGQAEEFAKRYDALKAGLSQAVREGRGDTSKMRVGAQFAIEKANDRDFATALKAVEQLERLVAAALATAAPQPTRDLTAYRTTLLEFDTAKKAVFARIDSLKSRIPSELPDEADFAGRLAEELHDLMDDIDDAVIDALNASKDEAEPVTAAVKSKIEHAMTVLRSNPLIKHVDSNPFGVNMAIESTLGAALTQVAKTMPAIA